MLFFDLIVKRVVSFSLESYDINKNQVLNFFKKNEKFQLTLLTASRSLYFDIKKNKSSKITLSLEKYFIRAHFNPTPFGLFSSVGVLSWGDQTFIHKSKTLLLHVKFDNSFLRTSIQNIKLSNNLSCMYFVNPSLHLIYKDKVAFYKSKILENSTIETSYVEVDYDADLKQFLDKFSGGLQLGTIIDELFYEGFVKLEVEEYLSKMIDIGLIISEFLYSSLNINGFFPSPVFSKLVEQQLHLLSNENDFMKFHEQYLKEQESHFKYNNTQKSSHAIDSFETELGTLNRNLQEKVIKFIDFTAQFDTGNFPLNDRLNKFAGKIVSKYNEGFISLNELFNPYSGLKYAEPLKSNKRIHNDILIKILSADDKKLFLNIQNKKENTNTNFPPTFSVIVESLQCKNSGEELFYIKGIGGTSAINMISRFGQVTDSLCKEIAQFEKDIHKNKIIAEVHCIGNLQTLNITPLKHYFDYAIPINTTISQNCELIFLSDLYVHIRNTNITLVSKSHKKQILPRLTSAINFRLSDSDIYNFLIELESQNQECPAVSFNMNYVENFYKPLIPRIYLDSSTILYPSQLLLINDDFTFDTFSLYLLKQINKFVYRFIYHKLSKPMLLCRKVCY